LEQAAVKFRVAMDARCLNTNFIRGMGEYVSSVVSQISATRDVEWIFQSNRPDLPFHSPSGSAESKTILRDIPGDRFHFWEQAALPFQALTRQARVLHCTATTMPLWQPVPTVVTIHDTIPWDTGEFLPAGFYRDRLLPMAFHRCARIITISQHSKNDIVRLWPKLADKITVIPHGVSDGFLHCPVAPLGEHLRRIGITQQYLLYVGGTTPRKRLDWTLELHNALACPGVALVVCGVPAEAHDTWRQRLPPEQRPRIVFAPFLPAEDMPSLYQNALLVMYPTLYEGFGFPALNAQAVGTPIVMSNVSSLRELAGPNAIALEPNDNSAWIDACRDLIDKRLANALPDPASQYWALQFDWRRSAEAHWDVYREAASRGRD
jgi:glycosyltransferase involved in cell wall biosynthesis